MSGPARCLALGLGGCLLAALSADGKEVMGIASGQDYQMVTTFCFTFPPAAGPGVPVPNGRIHLQSTSASSGHQFLLLSSKDLERGLPCGELEKRAKVTAKLGEKTSGQTSYDLNLHVEPSVNNQLMAAVIARCGQPVSAEYIVDFTNPSDDWDQHFACADQGLLQIYLGFSAMAAGLGSLAASAHRVLQQRQAHNEVSALFFAGTGFFVFRIWLFTIHLLVYSKNGMGLGMLLFVAQYLDFLSNTMGMLVLMSLVHGVYITRPCVPTGSMERNVLMQVVGAFTATYLVSTLACGFKVDDLLSPFGVLQGSASWPYLFARAGTGIFCFNRGIKLASTSEGQSKKPYILRFSLVAMGWLLLSPAMVIFSGRDSWNQCAWVMDMANFGMFGVVLHDFSPSRFGALFTCSKPTDRAHPYSEFGLPD